jgi:hypothetical protein
MVAVPALTSFALRTSAAAAGPETVLYSFCAQGGTCRTDGNAPVAGLIMDKAGRLYSTASAGAFVDAPLGPARCMS